MNARTFLRLILVLTIMLAAPLTLLEAPSVAVAQTNSNPVCTPPSAGLVAWWPGEGNATDIVNSNNGVLHGATFTPGVVSDAIRIDYGTYVEVADSASLDIAGTISVEGWISPGAATVIPGVINKADNAAIPAGAWDLTYSGAWHSFGFSITGPSMPRLYHRIFSPIGSVPAGTWSHVAATYDGGTIRLYVNGNPVAPFISPNDPIDPDWSPSPPPLTTNNSTLLIGAYQRNGVKEQFFSGSLDELSVYNRALSAAEIKSIYDAGSAGKCRNDDTDLSITMTDNPDPIAVDHELTYHLVVSNGGLGNATGVTVTDDLPPSVTFVSATPSQGACISTASVDCNLGDLAASASATVNIVVKPKAEGTITNSASVTANTPDPDPVNNTSTIVTEVYDPCLTDIDDDGIPGCIDGGHHPSGLFLPQDTIFSNTFSDKVLGGVTSGILFDAIGGGRVPPFIADISPACNRDRGGMTIDAIVIHYCQDTLAGCIRTFQQSPETGAHYVIGNKGEIVQMVPDRLKACHASYYNERSIGIELESDPYPALAGPDDFTYAMYESLANLIAALHNRHGIPLVHPTDKAIINPKDGYIDCINVAGILGHQQVQPYESTMYRCRKGELIRGKTDPGPHFHWPLLESLVRNRLDDLLNGPVVKVTELDNTGDPSNLQVPTGIRVIADGSTFNAATVIPACDISSINPFTDFGDSIPVLGGAVMRLYGGDVVDISCGSLKANVLLGPVEIILTQGFIVTVPSDTSVTLTGTNEGQLHIQSSPDSTGTTLVSFRGYTRKIAPGEKVAVIIPVTIDIQPDQAPNSINPRGRGVVPLAILSYGDFDATAVDPLSVQFGPLAARESHGRGHIEDVDHDGDNDLVLHFQTEQTGIKCGDTLALLLGSTAAGDTVFGSDAIVAVGCKEEAVRSAEDESQVELYLPLIAR